MKHTHRGTCQACGRIQAVNTAHGRIAKHGYTVDWGYFHGICQGSDAHPLEVDKTMTEAIINVLRENEAPRYDKRAADLRSGAVEPKWYKGAYKAGKYEEIVVPREELLSWEQDQILRGAIWNAERSAKAARQHADMLEGLIKARHAMPLIPVVNERKQLAVGSRVQIGGQKGVVCEVVEINDKVCSGCGPYLNGQTLPHAFLKRPDGRITAVPCRSIRQSAILEP